MSKKKDNVSFILNLSFIKVHLLYNYNSDFTVNYDILTYLSASIRSHLLAVSQPFSIHVCI